MQVFVARAAARSAVGDAKAVPRQPAPDARLRLHVVREAAAHVIAARVAVRFDVKLGAHEEQALDGVCGIVVAEWLEEL